MWSWISSCFTTGPCTDVYRVDRIRGEMYNAEIEIKEIIEGSEELSNYFLKLDGGVPVSLSYMGDRQARKVYENVKRHNHTPGSFVLCLSRVVCGLQRVRVS